MFETQIKDLKAAICAEKLLDQQITVLEVVITCKQQKRQKSAEEVNQFIQLVQQLDQEIAEEEAELAIITERKLAELSVPVAKSISSSRLSI